ncbi:MAG: phosphatase [Verrucomicrobiae bacterium]|nr:phosphatase [Verrucomicrobiae bacterium]
MIKNDHVAGALDIGSNTLKMLVVEKTVDGLREVGQRTSETRISAGISQNNPALKEESMARAIAVIGELYRDMMVYHPDKVRMVATSAVRDASNRDVFCKRVLKETGCPVDVISGEEEAQLIGCGVLTDPALKDQREILVFDMGGGSVECIYIKDRKIQFAESLPLGGVRLLEHHVADPSQPLKDTEIQAVVDSVARHVSRIPLQLEDPDKALVVGAGGTWITTRAMLAHRDGKTLEASSPYLELKDLESVFSEAASYTLEQRLQMPKLPRNRADVFPVTLLALMELGKWAGVTHFYNCFHSLRWGVASSLLENTRES